MATLDDPQLQAANILFPLVSIIITNYNYGKYIIPCIESVAAQTYPSWECFVVDDVSTDGSMDLVENFLEKHPLKERFTVIRRTQNGGQMDAFRNGLELSKGSLCTMLDADDVLLNDFLDTHVRLHLGRKAVAFTSTNQYQIDGSGAVLAGDHPDHQGKGKLRYVPDLVFEKGFWIWATASSMVFRTATLKLIMPKPDVTFRICADYYIAQFANLLGNSLLEPTIHGCYRRHGENNFGDNPIVGAVNSVGCLDKHPPHDEFRWVMITHIVENYPLFYRIYMEKGVVRLLSRLAKLSELKQIVRKNPDIFKRKWTWYVKQYADCRKKLWMRMRKTWDKRLIEVDSAYFYDGVGENTFP